MFKIIYIHVFVVVRVAFLKQNMYVEAREHLIRLIVRKLKRIYFKPNIKIKKKKMRVRILIL